MSLDQQQSLAQSALPLLDCGPLKVWSVVITLLGDVCQSRDSWLTGRVLDMLVTPMGITNQALRVALHRLKRDGWIEAQKQGRNSAYRLSDQGWASTEAARPTIYAPPQTPAPVWLALAPPDLAGSDMEDCLPEEALRLSPRSALVLTPSGDMAEWITTPLMNAPVPAWLADALCPEALKQEYSALLKACPDVAEISAVATPLSLDLLVLRFLSLHHWRRLRLRHSILPDAVLGNGWIGAEARTKVLALLAHLPRPSPEALELLLQDVRSSD